MSGVLGLGCQESKIILKYKENVLVYIVLVWKANILKLYT